MSTINQVSMQKIAVEIFELAKKFPGKIEVKNLKEPMSKKEVTDSFGHKFEAEFKIDDSAVLYKITELVRRGYRDHVWVMSNPFSLKYELYSY
jgi:anaerobic ribonucleoside-triphosphate reductase